MKYSLRSLFVVITVVAVLLGWRLTFLKGRANFHRIERDRCQLEFEHQLQIVAEQAEALLAVKTADDVPRLQAAMHGAAADYGEQLRLFKLHRDLELKYSEAIYRPWMYISETPPP